MISSWLHLGCGGPVRDQEGHVEGSLKAMEHALLYELSNDSEYVIHALLYLVLD